MRLVRALLLCLLVLGVLSCFIPAKASLQAQPWTSLCFFDRGSAMLKPECKRQLEIMASCWLDPQPQPNLSQEAVSSLLTTRHFTLQPFMSEEEFAELRSDQLAWARGRAALDFLIQLGLPKDLVTLELTHGGGTDLKEFSPQDPIQQRAQLIGCLKVLYGSFPPLELPPWPGRKPY